jgi:uncharacterized membrane-anchored protein
MRLEISKIPKEFAVLMKKKKIPCLQIGIKGKKELEVIVKRPERYNLKLLKKIPKTYKGLKVKIV